MKNLGDYCGFDSYNTWNASAIARLVFCNNTVIYIGFDTQKEERKCISGGFVGGIKEENLIAIFFQTFSSPVGWVDKQQVSRLLIRACICIIHLQHDVILLSYFLCRV